MKTDRRRSGRCSSRSFSSRAVLLAAGLFAAAVAPADARADQGPAPTTAPSPTPAPASAAAQQAILQAPPPVALVPANQPVAPTTPSPAAPPSNTATPTPEPAAAPAANPVAQPPGLAGTPGEAPGAQPLAPMPPEHRPEQVTGAQAAGEPPVAPPPGGPNDPAAERSMAFGTGAGQCRDTVPGGPMLAIAYAIVLCVLGAYVVLLARKNARLAAALDQLEADIARRRGPDARDATDEGDAE